MHSDDRAEPASPAGGGGPPVAARRGRITRARVDLVKAEDVLRILEEARRRDLGGVDSVEVRHGTAGTDPAD